MKCMKKTIFILCLLAASTHIWARQLIVGVAEERRDGSVSAPRSYISAIEQAGHIPFLIPDGLGEKELRKILKKVDILLLPGGEDVEPARYGAKPSPQLGVVNVNRDNFEWQILSEAVRQRKPIMGICRGLQMINVFLGGTLYQDLPSEYPDTTLHHRQDIPASSPSHLAIVSRDSRLYAVTQQDTLAVNTSHHQAIRQLAPGLRVTARATDGVIEGIECDSLPIAAVQFHPEHLAVNKLAPFPELFRQLKRLCKK